jgi:hypothetical protein
VCYFDVKVADDVTRNLQVLADGWCNIVGLRIRRGEVVR